MKNTKLDELEVVKQKLANQIKENNKLALALKQAKKAALLPNKLTENVIEKPIKSNQKAAKKSTVRKSKNRLEQELTQAREFVHEATKNAEIATDNAIEAARKAEDALKAKQQFLSNMSHEIRTPMNAIIGFTKVVLKTELNSKQREYLNAIKLSGDALIVLINDILDLAKVDAGKMTFSQIPFKLESSINSMIHLFEPKIQEKNISLTVEYDKELPMYLMGDPVRLHQIVLNLLSNAVKFTHTGEIKVSAHLMSEEPDSVMVEFKVKDTGIGISANKMGTIFENFQQASSNTSRLFGGTGLGLAIAKQLVESQGGNIHVESEIMVGSTFTFTLPFLKTDEKPEIIEDMIQYNSNPKNIRVLVVEDIALNQLLMKTLLEEFDFERDVAANGKIAIEKLKLKSYDIILMDLQMPEMNGFEATEYIRKTMQSTIPIIALTADVTTVDIDKCMAAGMNDYLAKPVDEKLLYKKIVHLVNEAANSIKSIKSNEADLKTLKKRYTNLAYLQKHTKSENKLLAEMIEIYLEQTPPLVLTMKTSFQERDWNMLQAAVHKIIPSFMIVGMSDEYAEMAKKIQEYTNAVDQIDDLSNLVSNLEEALMEACKELKEELVKLKSS